MLSLASLGCFSKKTRVKEDARIILLFEDVNYKVKFSKLRNFCESPETYCTFYFETDDLESIHLKAALQNRTSRREAICNVSIFTNDGNVRMQTVLGNLSVCEQLS